MLQQAFANALQHTINILNNIVIPEPHHLKTERLKKLGALRIRLHLPHMLPTIQLHNQLRIQADKIDHIAPHRPLPAKTKLFNLLVAQPIP